MQVPACTSIFTRVRSQRREVTNGEGGARYEFALLGFEITFWSVKVWGRSAENFKTKVPEIARRSHSQDADMIEKLNR